MKLSRKKTISTINDKKGVKIINCLSSSSIKYKQLFSVIYTMYLWFKALKF